MAQPPDFEFAEDANYPMDAEPEQGTPTKVDPAREDIGYRPNEHPTPQGFNYLLNLIALWIRWLHSSNTRKVAIGGGDYVKMSGAATYNSSEDAWTGPGVFRASIPIAQGETIDNVRFGFDLGGAGQMDFYVGRREFLADVFVQAGKYQTHTAGVGGGTIVFFDADSADLITAGLVSVEAGQNDTYWLIVEADNAANILVNSVVTLRRTTVP